MKTAYPVDLSNNIIITNTTNSQLPNDLPGASFPAFLFCFVFFFNNVAMANLALLPSSSHRFISFRSYQSKTTKNPKSRFSHESHFLAL